MGHELGIRPRVLEGDEGVVGMCEERRPVQTECSASGVNVVEVCVEGDLTHVQGVPGFDIVPEIQEVEPEVTSQIPGQQQPLAFRMPDGKAWCPLSFYDVAKLSPLDGNNTRRRGGSRLHLPGSVASGKQQTCSDLEEFLPARASHCPPSSSNRCQRRIAISFPHGGLSR